MRSSVRVSYVRSGCCFEDRLVGAFWVHEVVYEEQLVNWLVRKAGSGFDHLLVFAREIVEVECLICLFCG